MIWLSSACLIGPALFARWLNARMVWHYGAVVLGPLAVFALLRLQAGLWAIGIDLTILPLPPQELPVSAYLDTYYVVADTGTLTRFAMAFSAPSLLFALTWRTPDRPRDTALFWTTLTLSVATYCTPSLMTWHLEHARETLPQDTVFAAYNTAATALSVALLVTAGAILATRLHATLIHHRP